MIQTSLWAKVRRWSGALWVVALVVSARAAQPPLNMCATTLLDGGPPPGFYYLNYAIFTEGKKFRDGDGNEVARAVEDVDRLARSAASGAEESQAAARNLCELAAKMHTLAQHFRS